MQGAWGEKRDPGVGLSVEAAGLWAFGSECPDRCRLNAEEGWPPLCSQGLKGTREQPRCP